MGKKKELRALREEIHRQCARQEQSERAHRVTSERLAQEIASVREAVEQLAPSVEKYGTAVERQATANRITQEIASVREAVEQLTSSAGKHDMAIEDMLDSWEEIRAANEQRAENLRDRLIEQMKKEAAGATGREAALTEALVAGADQLHILLHAAEEAGDTGWARQIRLAESAQDERLAKAGIQRVAQTDVPFSYELHEALKTVPAENREQDMTVAAVYTPGYWANGRRIRKAGVAVYQWGEKTNERTDRD